MKFVCSEKLILTKEEYTILDKARILLDDIYMSALKGGEIEKRAGNAMEIICDLLSEEYTDFE